MKDIKRQINTYLWGILLSVVLVILVVSLVMQMLSVQRQAREEAADRFDQIEHILEENEKDRTLVAEELREDSLRCAEVVAYMYHRHPDLSGDVQRFREIAALLKVEEINVFNSSGTIFTGTNPEYFGLNFDSGEQMAYFKPMLAAKDARLSQEIMPNTYNGRMMRYSAVWCENGEVIVQVGDTAEVDLRVTEKYELSYIFSLLRVESAAEFYAIDKTSGEIVGASTQEDVGKHLSDVGLDLTVIEDRGKGFHARVHDKNSYCVFTTMTTEGGETLVGRVLPNTQLYRDLPVWAAEFILLLGLVVAILMKAVTQHLDHVVVRNIARTNEKLRAITAGDLDERVDLRSSTEFSELSDHINEMVESLSEKLYLEYQYKEELTEAIRQADAANQSKSAFLFHMSHDIRTPMNAILGFSSLAEKHIDDKERVLDCLQKLNSAGDHLLRLINDVLDMSRIESGKVEINVKPSFIPGALAEIDALFSLEMQQKGITFSVSWDLQDEIVFYDKLHLEQVQLNLLGNALKYTPAGGRITYRVEQLGPAEKGIATYRGIITDTGIGMSEEFCPRVFEPFEREHSSTVNGLPGTGLGLAITKRLLEQMGGTITCTSQVGVGTEFVFTIPLRVGSPADLEPAERPTAADLDFTGKRILLVEDNELNREIACEILLDCGFLVDTAEDGVIAVEKVAQGVPGTYDLILMDIQMPRMDGYEAALAIRKLPDPLQANIPIVAFTANAFEEDQKKAYSVGMNGHLAKPIDVGKLLETLAHFL